jgi:ribosomal protein S18 acetylase RimI-like enzyme
LVYKVIEISGSADIEKFIKFPGKHIFGKSDYWVPPLISQEIKRFDSAKCDYYSYGSSKLFAAINEKGKWVGRIACFINSKYIEKTKRTEGFFGFFDSINDPDVARVLFASIVEEFNRNNITEVVGPVNFSTNEESGLLIDGFDISPTFMTNYSKPYYKDLLENLDFQKFVDLYAFEWKSGFAFPVQFHRIVEAVKKRSSVKIRRFEKKNFRKELDNLWPVYNESFRDVWGFTPLTREEFEEMGNSFKFFADYDLIMIAELNGKVIGLGLILPDINILIKKINGKLFPFGIFTLLTQKDKMKSLRLNVLAVLPEYRNLGVAAMLIDNLVNTVEKKKYHGCELSVVLESNIEMIRLLKTLNFKTTRTFRIYRSKTENLKLQ